jgi:hypothetical protein
MKYIELKQQIKELELEKRIGSFNGFEESLEFKNFKTFFSMIDEPNYTLMQCKNSEEFNTSSETWFLCLPKNGQMYVIDAGNEEEICDQFYLLVEIFAHGFGKAEIELKK